MVSASAGMGARLRRLSARTLLVTGSSDRRLSVWTFLCLFAAAACVQRSSLYVYDGRVMFGITQNLVDHHSLRTTYDALHLNTPYASYGIGMSLAFIPGYLLALLVDVDPQTLAPLTNGWIIALTGVALVKLAKWAELGRLVGVLAALLYAVLSMAFGYMSDGFSEPGVALGTVTALAGLVRWRREPPSGALVVGFGLGLTVLFRTDSVLLVVAPLLFLTPVFVGWDRLQCHRRSLVMLAVPLTLTLAWTGWYDALRFGSPFATGYPGQVFNTPLLMGLNGLLLQGGRGFFYFNPALLLALPGLVLLGHRDHLLAWILAGLGVLRLFFYARWWSWYGGVCWGPRFLEPAAALLALPAALALVRAFDRTSPLRTLRRAAVLAACAVGAVVSALAVLVPYEAWWNAHTGPFTGPVPPRLEQTTWSQPGKHDLLFSLRDGQLGGNVRLLFHQHQLPLRHFTSGLLWVGLVDLGVFAGSAERALRTAFSTDTEDIGTALAITRR